MDAFRVYVRFVAVQALESVQLGDESWRSPRPEGPKALSLERPPQERIKDGIEATKVATATFGIAVATSWLKSRERFKLWAHAHS